MMFEIKLSDKFYAPYIKMGASHIGKTKQGFKYVIIYHEPIYNLNDVIVFLKKYRKEFTDSDILGMCHGMSGDQLKDIRKSMIVSTKQSEEIKDGDD